MTKLTELEKQKAITCVNTLKQNSDVNVISSKMNMLNSIIMTKSQRKNWNMQKKWKSFTRNLHVN